MVKVVINKNFKGKYWNNVIKEIFFENRSFVLKSSF